MWHWSKFLLFGKLELLALFMVSASSKIIGAEHDTHTHPEVDLNDLSSGIEPLEIMDVFALLSHFT